MHYQVLCKACTLHRRMVDKGGVETRLHRRAGARGGDSLRHQLSFIKLAEKVYFMLFSCQSTLCDNGEIEPTGQSGQAISTSKSKPLSAVTYEIHSPCYCL